MKSKAYPFLAALLAALLSITLTACMDFLKQSAGKKTLVIGAADEVWQNFRVYTYAVDKDGSKQLISTNDFWGAPITSLDVSFPANTSYLLLEVVKLATNGTIIGPTMELVVDPNQPGIIRSISSPFSHLSSQKFERTKNYKYARKFAVKFIRNLSKYRNMDIINSTTEGSIENELFGLSDICSLISIQDKVDKTVTALLGDKAKDKIKSFASSEHAIVKIMEKLTTTEINSTTEFKELISQAITEAGLPSEEIVPEIETEAFEDVTDALSETYDEIEDELGTVEVVNIVTSTTSVTKVIRQWLVTTTTPQLPTEIPEISFQNHFATYLSPYMEPPIGFGLINSPLVKTIVPYSTLELSPNGGSTIQDFNYYIFPFDMNNVVSAFSPISGISADPSLTLSALWATTEAYNLSFSLPFAQANFANARVTFEIYMEYRALQNFLSSTEVSIGTLLTSNELPPDIKTGATPIIRKILFGNIVLSSDEGVIDIDASNTYVKVYDSNGTLLGSTTLSLPPSAINTVESFSGSYTLVIALEYLAFAIHQAIPSIEIPPIIDEDNLTTSEIPLYETGKQNSSGSITIDNTTTSLPALSINSSVDLIDLVVKLAVREAWDTDHNTTLEVKANDIFILATQENSWPIIVHYALYDPDFYNPYFIIGYPFTEAGGTIPVYQNTQPLQVSLEVIPSSPSTLEIVKNTDDVLEILPKSGALQSTFSASFYSASSSSGTVSPYKVQLVIPIFSKEIGHYQQWKLDLNIAVMTYATINVSIVDEINLSKLQKACLIKVSGLPLRYNHMSQVIEFDPANNNTFSMSLYSSTETLGTTLTYSDFVWTSSVIKYRSDRAPVFQIITSGKFPYPSYLIISIPELVQIFDAADGVEDGILSSLTPPVKLFYYIDQTTNNETAVTPATSSIDIGSPTATEAISLVVKVGMQARDNLMCPGVFLPVYTITRDSVLLYWSPTNLTNTLQATPIEESGVINFNIVTFDNY